MDGNGSMMSNLIQHQNMRSQQLPILKRRNHPCLGNRETQLVCHKRRKGKETVGESSLKNVKWKYLHPSILGQIFCRLSVVDLFINVSLVCPSWEATCWDFLFWSRTVFYLSATGAGFGMVDMSTVEFLYPPQPERAPGFFGKLDSQEKCNSMSVSLMRKLRCIMETGNPIMVSLQSWRMSLTTVILPYDLEISDDHLLYIAERTPCVRHLLLLCTSKITADGFTKAMKCWKHLKGMHLGLVKDDLLEQFLMVIGTNCKEFESLHLHYEGYELDTRSAQLIARALPGLKKLELELANVKRSGFTTLYNMCLQLEEVYFNGCRLLTDSDHPQPAHEQPAPDFFRLMWTTDETVFVKWEVMACPIQERQVDNYYRSNTTLMDFIYSSKYLEYSSKYLEYKKVLDRLISG